MMQWLRLLWPWSQARKARAAEIQAIDKRFQEQLAVAERRHASLMEAVTQIREEREKRQEAPRVSHPTPIPQE